MSIKYSLMAKIKYNTYKYKININDCYSSLHRNLIVINENDIFYYIYETYF